MIRTAIVLIVGCTMGVAALAATCNQNTWTFTAGSGGAQCGSGNDGVTFTQNGETITIIPELVGNGSVEAFPFPVDGLFEVGKGENGNLASGIGPFISDDIGGEGGSPYTSQQGIQEANFLGPGYDAMLYIEVSQNGAGAIPSGTTLSFLMQEGDVADTFNVYTSVGSSTTAPNLGSMSEVDSNVSVGTMNGGATTPQFSVKTDTSAEDPIEFIAIKADCTYLLLNSITAETSTVPEPRFYGLLLAGLLGLAAIVYRRQRSAAAQI